MNLHADGDFTVTKISLLLTFPFDIGDQDYVVPIKVSDHLSLIDQYLPSLGKILHSKPNSVRVNMIPKPDLTYEKIDWSSCYKYRAFVAYKDSILAVGGYRYGGENSSFSSVADLYNTITQMWTKLPDMIEPRRAPALVVVNDEVCAVKGEEYLILSTITIECYNSTSNSWSLKFSELYPDRENPAAASVLNDTLWLGELR